MLVSARLVAERKTEAQRAKKVVSNSPGLVDFVIGLVNFVFNLPDWHAVFFLRNISSKSFWG